MNTIQASGTTVEMAIQSVVDKSQPTLEELDAIKDALADLRNDIALSHGAYVAALESLNELMPNGEELDPEGDHEAWEENFDEVAKDFYDMFGGE